ncbi:MAG: carbohydrate kinase family protein [Cellulosilyticaceae bacterium]
MTMIESTQPYVLVFGISICDIFGFTHNSYRAYDSNPGRVKMSYGGVCRNIAENMARIGTQTKFISVLGDDEKGKGIIEHATNHGFDMTHSMIVPGGSTPTYIAILDESGEMVSAVVDIDIVHQLTPAFVDSKAEVIEGAAYMIFDADNAEIVEHIVTKYKGKTRFVLDPVSAAKASTVKHLLPSFHTIKPNRYEAQVLCGFELDSEAAIREAGAYFRGLGVENVYISLDADGIYYNCEEGEGIIKANGANVVNVTGAGDSFVAGISHGYMQTLSVVDTVKFAMAMSVITIEHEETIHPEMNYEYVVKHIQSIQWEQKTYR